ncbi:hypothetical protein LIS44_16705 (plasmid) [Acinetobacter haemolyticus]|nr:hypothetical protein LIS44_16705 [Acinetobacter haemolyticus]
MIASHYQMTNSHKDRKISIPNLGWVKMTEDLRYQGKILSAKIFKQGGKWFASIAVELNQPEKLHPKTGYLLVLI